MSVRLAALVLLVAAPAAADVELRTSLKATALLSRAPDDPALAPEPAGASTFFRLRFEPKARPADWLTADVAYELSLRTDSGSGGLAGLGALPADAPAPYRVWPIAGDLATGTGYAFRHELDRAFLGFHLPGVELTAGRQAIGWGRGVLFGAVDLFAPFAPLEVDREWRRGVDAVRADVKLSDRTSLDAVAAFGESLDDSAFAGRARGYAGDLDVELVVGWRARDLLAGATASAPVGDAELHGELAVFRTPDDDAVVKAVAGGSYRFDVGTGLVVYAEYHYSGFGAARPEDVIARLAGDPGFRARVLRGDTQILGRHAVALVASYEVSPELALSLLWLTSPADGSGVVAPTATATLGDKLSVVLTVDVPYGAAPVGAELRSDYGAASLAGLVQIRIYE